MNTAIRNIGIIAHVDHGKTTLVDRLLESAGVWRDNQERQERAMDSMDLEREKGITIKAKNAAFNWNNVRINIVDTPGHADFGGEVERILKMVDGVLLLVDAVDGPQAQTRFVLRKAIENGLKVVVVINKIDRELAAPHRVHDEVLELFLELHATEEQFNAPFLYVSGKEGYAKLQPDDPPKDMSPLMDAIIQHIPPPTVRENDSFELLVSNLDWNSYVGRIAIGKITAGRVALGDTLYCAHGDGTRNKAKIMKLYTFSGMGFKETEACEAGDIAGIAGFEKVWIGETFCGREDQPPLPFVDIDPPTIHMQFCVNDGPLAGREGKFLTARHLRDRLNRETHTNVSLQVSDTDRGNIFEVKARGELQIAILVETMRREGYELLVSRPEVIYREENGVRLEPYETLWIEIGKDFLGDCMQYLSNRKAQITNMEHHGSLVDLEAVIPTRGLIGFESFLVNLTSGTAIMSHMFKEYGSLAGPIVIRTSGTLVSMENGFSTPFALDGLQERARLFIGPGEEVYEGMIIGENSRPDDLPCNPTKAKHLTNMRASGSDKNVILEPPLKMSLERAIEFIAPDEYVEATPKTIRLRKRVLNAHLRKRANQAAQVS